MKLAITSRELDLIIDSVIHRNEALEDIAVFSINPLAVKLRLKEQEKLLTALRSKRDEKTI